MRVLVVASFAESLLNFRGPLLRSMVEQSYLVHVAAPGLVKGSRVGDELRKMGVVCHDINLQRNGINPVEDLKTFFQLYRLMKKLKIELYLGYTIKPVIWGLNAASLAGVQKRIGLITGLGYAFTGDAIGLRNMVQKFAKLLYRLALRQATLVFFQNPDDFEEFSSTGILQRRCPVEIVNGSGVDTVKYEHVPFPSTQTINFLLIARLIGDKGIREYLTAADCITQKHPHTRFHLVGGLDTNPDGITEKEVMTFLKEGHIQWFGSVTDVRQFIANSHVYVLPSYREGTPRSVLEAMSMGRPIITTDAPGCRETVVNGANGFLVDVKCVDSLVAAMERFVNEPELIETMGRCSREIACEKYDVHKVNAHMLKAIGVS